MKIHGLIMIAAAILAAGCSFCESSTQIVAINVIPSNAKVLANGKTYSGSPMFVQCNRSNELMLLAYCPGYRSESYVIGNHLSTTGILDACGTIFLFPYLGLCTNGAWALDETNITIRLQPLTEAELAQQIVAAGNAQVAVDATVAAAEAKAQAISAAANAIAGTPNAKLPPQPPAEAVKTVEKEETQVAAEAEKAVEKEETKDAPAPEAKSAPQTPAPDANAKPAPDAK
ncbi:MAG: hypothetical protein AB7F40_05590 [Victivallaceae bacterium]|nr:hypothetical protein [Victivallaceae bacterium]